MTKSCIFVVTPWLLCLVDHLNEWILLTRQAKEVHGTEETWLAIEAGQTTAVTVEDKRPAPVEGQKVKVPSTSSYNSFNSSGDAIASFSWHSKLGLRKVGDHVKAPALTSNVSWWKKYYIGPGIEIYQVANTSENPFLSHTIIFYEGLLRVASNCFWLHSLFPSSLYPVNTLAVYNYLVCSNDSVRLYKCSP